METSTTGATRRGGRKSKGNRRAIMLRTPDAIAKELDDLREAAGATSMNDFINYLLGELTGIPAPLVTPGDSTLFGADQGEPNRLPEAQIHRARHAVEALSERKAS